MTIAKGRPWGTQGSLPDDGVVVHSDAEASRVLTEARYRGASLPVLGLLGGDLCATMGGSGSIRHLRDDDARRYPIDLGIVRLDGVEHLFVAHVVGRRRFWYGRSFAAMNAQWFGDWDLGPKSHPNDGLLDISDGALPLGERLRARRRVRTGTHVPHPRITTKRVRNWDTRFERPIPILVDGVPTGAARTIEFEVAPDAFTVVI